MSLVPFFRRFFQHIVLHVLVLLITVNGGGFTYADVGADSYSGYSGLPIDSIEVSGNKRIEKPAIFEKILTKTGTVLEREKIRNDIQMLFALGYFDQVEVKAKKTSAGKIQLTYEVQERSVISEIDFEGNEKVKTEDLKEVVKVKEWAILDLNKVREDVALIQKHYEDKGYYLTKVSYELESSKDKGKEDHVKLTYRINDFDKVRIKKITFLNNKEFSDEALKTAFGETKEGAGFTFSGGTFKEAAFKQDLQRLTYWYLDHGFVKFRYENPVVTVSDDKKWVYISIYVEEGDKYQIGKVDFSGDLLFPKEDLAADVKMTTGKDFAITQRNLDIQKLSERYQDLGYAFVNVIPKMEFRDSEKLVDLDYSFEKGNLVYFGEFNVVGNTKTHDKVIRREMKIREGELYHGTRYRQSKERVERLGYFAPNEVVFNLITRKGRDDLVDVEITVKERSTGTVTLGAGYGSAQGFFFQSQVSEINLMGRGQTLSFQASWALDNIQRAFNIGFTEPYFLDSDWSLGGDAYWNTNTIPDRFVQRKLGYDVRTGYPILEDVQFFVTFKHELTQTMRKFNPNLDTRPDEGILKSVTWSLVRDVRNNRYETTDGSYQTLSFESAGIPPLYGDKKFLKLLLNTRYYKRLVGDLIFKTSQEYGHIWSIGQSPVPSGEKFYLGGPNNMKGFQFASLGPRVEVVDPEGNVTVQPQGGKIQLFSLFELEYPLIREAGLKAVVFYDIGNAFDEFPGTGSEQFTLRSDVGMGLRWFSPIGPLRFEWGWPLRAKPTEENPVFQFFIGQPF